MIWGLVSSNWHTKSIRTRSYWAIRQQSHNVSLPQIWSRILNVRSAWVSWGFPPLFASNVAIWCVRSSAHRSYRLRNALAANRRSCLWWPFRGRSKPWCNRSSSNVRAQTAGRKAPSSHKASTFYTSWITACSTWSLAPSAVAKSSHTKNWSKTILWETYQK